jgi:hypothetical protein
MVLCANNSSLLYRSPNTIHAALVPTEVTVKIEFLEES